MKIIIKTLMGILISTAVFADIKGNTKGKERAVLKQKGSTPFSYFSGIFLHELKQYGLESLGNMHFGDSVAIRKIQTTIYTVIFPEDISEWDKNYIKKYTSKYLLKQHNVEILSERKDDDAYFNMKLSFGLSKKYEDGSVKHRSKQVELIEIGEFKSSESKNLCSKVNVTKFKIREASSQKDIGEIELCGKNEYDITTLCTGKLYSKNCDLHIDENGTGIKITIK